MNNTNKLILTNIDCWLKTKDKNRTYLAAQLNITPSYLSQIFNGKRPLRPQHVAQFCKLTGLSVTELTKSAKEFQTPAYFLRGAISTPQGHDALVQLLSDTDHYASLLAL